jgi:hypothetical protein
MTSVSQVNKALNHEKPFNGLQINIQGMCYECGELFLKK